MYLDVYDEDNVNDELIGRVAIDVITILENPQKELAFEDIISDIKVKEGTNYGTLRTAFKWQPSNDCENVLGNLNWLKTLQAFFLFFFLIHFEA